MRHHGIRAITARRFRTCTTDSRHDWPIAPNRLNQNFAADRPNQVWLADITYVPTSEGWLYLAVVLDLFTRKIVGWAMRDHMRAHMGRFRSRGDIDLVAHNKNSGAVSVSKV